MDEPNYTPTHRTPRWVSEYDVREAIAQALLEVVEEHGGAAKAFAWDVNHKLSKALSEMRS